jgi:hypothetical protein
MGFLVAAYLVVLVSLAVYGLRLHSRRRELLSRRPASAAGSKTPA